MNKLIFSEGGQPIYLEDLKMLQNYYQTMVKALLSPVLNQDEACLLQPYQVTNSVTNPTDFSRTLTVTPGTLIYDGMLCPFEGATVTVAKENSPWLCLEKIKTDLRVFEDGQQRYCQEGWTAHISTSADGAEKAWRMDNLKSYVELLDFALKSRQKKESIKCTFYNDYSGSLKVDDTEDGRDTVFTIDVSTSATEWRKDAIGWKGMIGRIDESEYVDLLAGHKTPAFLYQGKKYQLYINDLGNIFVYPEGVSDIYSEAVVIPLMPISFTFTYDDVLSTRP